MKASVLREVRGAREYLAFSLSDNDDDGRRRRRGGGEREADAARRSMSRS